jgi:hypothetical protein
MVAIKALTVLALAGATIAVPVAQPLQVGDALVRRDAEPGWGGDRANYRWGWGRPQGQGQSSDAGQTQSQPQASQPQASQPQTEQPASSDSGSSSGSSGSPPASSPSTPPSSGGSSGGSGYMAVVQQWRSNMGLPALTEDNTLQSNALDTSVSSGGQLVHKLNAGSMAQVMAPGNTGNFESVFVGGWLCEMPGLKGLGASVCDSASQGWNHGGQTGHAEILSSTQYTKIGCGNADDMWTCDLA